jgi:hypothetical protein
MGREVKQGLMKMLECSKMTTVHLNEYPGDDEWDTLNLSAIEGGGDAEEEEGGEEGLTQVPRRQTRARKRGRVSGSSAPWR